MSDLITVTVPAKFYDDHCERFAGEPDVDSGEERGRKGHRVCIGISEAGLAELYDDARYYAKDVDQAPPSIVASARRTVAAIERLISNEAVARIKARADLRDRMANVR